MIAGDQSRQSVIQRVQSKNLAVVDQIVAVFMVAGCINKLSGFVKQCSNVQDCLTPDVHLVFRL